jgi:hypothetical protein
MPLQIIVFIISSSKDSAMLGLFCSLEEYIGSSILTMGWYPSFVNYGYVQIPQKTRKQADETSEMPLQFLSLSKIICLMYSMYNQVFAHFFFFLFLFPVTFVRNSCVVPSVDQS